MRGTSRRRSKASANRARRRRRRRRASNALDAELFYVILRLAKARGVADDDFISIELERYLQDVSRRARVRGDDGGYASTRALSMELFPARRADQGDAHASTNEFTARGSV